MGWRPMKREVPGHWTAEHSRWEAAAAVAPAVAAERRSENGRSLG
jgi:hypothetical protein